MTDVSGLQDPVTVCDENADHDGCSHVGADQLNGPFAKNRRKENQQTDYDDADIVIPPEVLNQCAGCTGNRNRHGHDNHDIEEKLKNNFQFVKRMVQFLE